MITISHNNKVYHIEKEKLTFVLEKLSGKTIKENEIKKLMEKFCLYDESFLKRINQI